MTRNSNSRLLIASCLALAVAALSASLAMAQTQTWTATNAGNLLNGQNWSGGIAPNGINHIAVISTNPLPNQTAFGLPDNSTITLGAFQHSNPRDSGISAPTARLIMSSSTGNALFQVSHGSMGTHLAEIQLQSSTVFDMSGLGGNPNQEHPLGGTITGAGALIKTGPDRIRLFDNNSYTGGTEIHGGAVRGFSIADEGIDSAFGRGNFVLSGGGVLMLSDSNGATNRTFSLGAGGGAFHIERSLTLNGVIRGVDGFDLKAGTLVLTAPNTYSGSTRIGEATLRTGSGSVIPDTSAVQMLHSNSTLDLTGQGEYVGSLAGTGQVLLDANAMLGTGSDGTDTTFRGEIRGSGSLTKIGPGTFTLTNANSYSGTTLIAGGLLHLKDEGSIAESAFINIRGGTLLRTGGDLINSAYIQLPNGSSKIVVEDFTLRNSGTINGRLGTIVGNVITDAGGLISGQLTIDGDMTIGSGGTVSPGTGVGAMNVLGNSTFGDGGSYEFGIHNALGTPGNTWDHVAINGALSLTATPVNPFTIAFAPTVAFAFDPLQNYAWTFVTAEGDINGFNPHAFSVDLSSLAQEFVGRFAVTQQGNALQLTYSVPEPSSLALAFFAGMGSWLVRRRRGTSK
jgi:fibronectin-binding autotransporter adhesin